MVQRSLPFLLLAGMLSCKGDPTSSLRNGVNQLTATPTEIILDSASTQTVQIDARDEQGNPVDAKFAIAATGAGITVTFDTTFNVVRDANGNLKPQNPATRVRYVVKGTAVGASSFTISGGGKSVTVSVRVPPPAVAATIDKPTPNPGDTITVTLPAPYTFAFDPADTTSVATTIGGNTCKVIAVAAGNNALSCIPLPGSVGTVALKNVLPNFGGLGPISVNTVGTVSLPLPTLTFSPANPQAGDTVKIIAPAPYKFGAAATGSDTSAITLSGARFARTVRTADSLKFLVGPGIDAPLSVTRFRIPGFAGSSNLFTLSAAGNLTTPAAPVLVTTPGGSVAIGSTVTVTASGRYRFSPTATTITIPSTLSGINAGATVLSVSADSLTLTYGIGANVDAAKATINGVRITAAAALGGFSLATDKAFTTPSLDQFPATLSNQLPNPGDQPVTLTAGAGFKFTPSSTVLVGNPLTKALVQGISADSSQLTFLPAPNSGKAKPVVSGVIQTASPTVRMTLPAAVYLTAGPPAPVPDLDHASTFVLPGVGQTASLVGFAPFIELPECDTQAFGAFCRPYKVHLNAPASFHVIITQSGGNFDMGLYPLTAARTRINAGICDDLGSAAKEECDITLPAGDLWLLVVNFSSSDPPDWQVSFTGQ